MAKKLTKKQRRAKKLKKRTKKRRRWGNNMAFLMNQPRPETPGDSYIIHPYLGLYAKSWLHINGYMPDMQIPKLAFAQWAVDWGMISSDDLQRAQDALAAKDWPDIVDAGSSSSKNPSVWLSGSYFCFSEANIHVDEDNWQAGIWKWLRNYDISEHDWLNDIQYEPEY